MKNPVIARLVARGRGLLRRLRGDRRGNIMMILGFAMIPMVFGTGFGIDYSKAMKLRTRMNAAADAAALAAVNVTMMRQSDAQAIAAARAMFNAQVRGLPGMIYDETDATQLTIALTSSGGVNSGRTVTVTYTARSTNSFGGILGVPTLPVNGSAQANATRAPHINFYLLMDTSPSMLLPADSAGLNNIRAKTGCAFACHQQRPQDEGTYIRPTIINPQIWLDNSNAWCPIKSMTSTKVTCQNNTQYNVSNGKIVDMWLDISGGSCPIKSMGSGKVTCPNGTKYDIVNGVYYNTMWVDNSGASCPLKVYATPNITCENGTQYAYASGQVADSYWLTRNFTAMYGGSNITLRIDEEQLAAQNLIPFAITTAANNQVTYKLQLFTFDYTRPGETTPVKAVTASMANVNTMSSYTVPNFYARQDNWFANNCPTSSWCNSDQGTEVINAMTTMNSLIPTPGAGDTVNNPQAVLFIITDGVVDERQSGSRRNREFSATNDALCTTIKNRGIRIAILYTEYLPESLTGNQWSQDNVAPHLPKIEPALKSCASARTDGTPLYYKVTTDESISNALTALFSLTVQSAHLTR